MSQTGHTQLSSNVAASAVAFAVAVVIGFIMPRLIYESVGQIPLGLWDLGWSFLIYVSFSGIGFGPAISYFTANLRASGDFRDVTVFCATGVWCQLVFALALALTFVGGFSLIAGSATQIGANDSELLGQIGFYLGLSVGFVVFGDFAQGLLLGSHKARVAELINTAHDIALAVAMIIALLLGYGIVGLAVVTAVLRFAAEAVRFSYATSHCMEFSAHPELFRVSAVRKLVRYGIKTSVSVVQELVLFQIARLVLFFSAGPLALAAFSRYTTIARQINRLVDRLSISVPAIASGYLAEGNQSAIRALYLNGAQAGLLLTLPIVCIFAVYGDAIVQLWMGEEFVVANVSSLLAGACLLHSNYAISNRTLSGTNQHGRISLLCLFASAFVMLVAVQITFPLTQVEAAGIIMLASIIAVQLPYIVFAGFKLQISVHDLVTQAYGKPLLVNTLFLAALLGTRNMLANGYPLWSFTLVVAASLALLYVYWRFILSASSKQAIRELRNVDLRMAS